ncbi:MAG: efflux RND transporter periplasmic adaptor subunit [Phycisphaerales bacterium]|nr:efflux RND transporter periplasmic adaptor subunit [Phycisphaerales bacterium]
MNTTTHHPIFAMRLAALLALFAVALLALAASPGCKKHDDNDHDAQPPGKEDEHSHEGHDHDAEGHDGHGDEVALTSEAIERYGIRIEPAQKRVLKPTLLVPARIEFNANGIAHIGSPLAGRAVAINVRVGDSVKAGDSLLVIESPDLGEAQSGYLAKRATAEASAPASQLAKAAWERAKGVYERSQGIALAEVQRRESEWKAAVANQKAADAAVAAAASRLRLLGMSQEAVDELARTGVGSPRHAITAPIAGSVVQREVTQGELVGPDRESLLVLADTSTLWVLADVPATRLAEVEVGAPASVMAGAGSQAIYNGTVSFIAPMVDAATRTVQVRIAAPASELNLKPGMFAQVEIEAKAGGAEEPAPVLAVPDAAIQTVEGQTVIFVPVEGEFNTFAKRIVRIGKAIGGWVPIYSGLGEDEEYISAASFILKAELGKGSAAHEH